MAARAGVAVERVGDEAATGSGAEVGAGTPVVAGGRAPRRAGGLGVRSLSATFFSITLSLSVLWLLEGEGFVIKSLHICCREEMVSNDQLQPLCSPFQACRYMS